jgi:CRISPR-associated protein (TIGR02584 family)
MEEGLKHILLCVAGGTPQVITETLYALTQERGERVDEVRVITTPRGQQEILDKLLRPQQGRFFQFCQDYGIDPATIRFDPNTITLLCTEAGEVLTDLISDGENQSAIDHICRIVRGLTQDAGTRLHASVGGGRKTMSIALTMAMQLFGRAQDRLSHVLVAGEYESHPQFYYPRPQPEVLSDRDGQPITAAAWVSLAEISFIRLGGVLATWLSDDTFRYGQIVARAQEELDIRNAKLYLHTGENALTVGGRRVKLTKMEFFLFLLLAQCARQAAEGALKLSQLTGSRIEAAFRAIYEARDKDWSDAETALTAQDARRLPGYGFVKSLLRDVERKRIDELSKSFGKVKSDVNRKLAAAGLLDICQIEKRGAHESPTFCLTIPAARLEIS